MTRKTFYILFLVAAIKADDFKSNPSRAHPMFGVASIAGVTSRNGRISSLGGVKLFPGPGSTKVTNDRSYFYPMTVAAEKDGHFATGSVQIFPGSRGVSTAAVAGYMPDFKGFSTRPLFNELLFTPQEMLMPKGLEEPWFFKDMLKSIPPPKIDMSRNAWYYPSYNPFFSFWR